MKAVEGTRVRIGVSSCLLGEPVRYDGGHKRDAFVVETLGAVADFVPVCPEVEVGMGVPRETIRLQYTDAGDAARHLHLVAPASGRDYTAAMQQYARTRVRALGDAALDGYVLKARSPSCGLAVTVAGDGGRHRGLYAAELARSLPRLPIAEDEDLADPAARLHFVLRVFAHARLRRLVAGRCAPDDLAAFHRRERVLLIAHDEDGEAALAALLDAGHRDLARAYGDGFARALARRPAPSDYVAAVDVAAAPLDRHLGEHERAQMATLWTAFAADPVAGLPALVDAVRAAAWHHGVGAVLECSFFDPEPLSVARGHRP